MRSLCRLPVAKNRNFRQILTILELLYWPPFTDEGTIWCATADPRSTHTRKVSCEFIHCLGFRWPKTTILGKFWHLGAPVPPPFYQWETHLVCYSQPTVNAYVPNFVSIRLFCRPLAAKNPSECEWVSSFLTARQQNPNFCRFFGLRHLVLSSIGSRIVTWWDGPSGIEAYP